MTVNYGRKYITISVGVKLYFPIFWSFIQTVGLVRWTRPANLSLGEILQASLGQSIIAAGPNLC